MTNSNINLEEAFGLANLSAEERDILAADIGGLVMESATLRFLAESDEVSGQKFARIVDAYADRDDLLDALCDNFPAFTIILEEEINAFREDARRVLLAAN